MGNTRRILEREKTSALNTNRLVDELITGQRERSETEGALKNIYAEISGVVACTRAEAAGGWTRSWTVYLQTTVFTRTWVVASGLKVFFWGWARGTTGLRLRSTAAPRRASASLMALDRAAGAYTGSS